MTKPLLFICLLFLGLSHLQAQEKQRVPAPQRVKQILVKEDSVLSDSLRNKGKRAVANTSQKLSNQRKQLAGQAADAKEKLKEGKTAVANVKMQVPKIEKPSLPTKPAMGNQANEQATELKTKGKAQVDQTKAAVQAQKKAVLEQTRFVKDGTKLPKPDSVAKQAARQQVVKTKEQWKDEKKKLKQTAGALKDPGDVDVTWDNNGVGGKSDKSDRVKQQIQQFKQAGNGSLPGLPSMSAPSIPGSSSPTGLGNSSNPSANPTGTSTGNPIGTMPISTAAMPNAAVPNIDDSSLVSPLPAEEIKTIYSQRRLEAIKDSLGAGKFDSLYNKASMFTKKEVSKEELLQTLNRSFATPMPPNEKELTQDGMINKAQRELPSSATDLEALKGNLPTSELGELPPLSGQEFDSKYLKMVDSLRSTKLNEQGLKLAEKKVDGQISEAIIKRKPTFWDRAYFDGVVGILSDNNSTIVQASPSLGFHIWPTVSVGVGPTISLQRQDKNLFASMGARSFVKVELFKQRAYAQTEYQVSPYQVDYKSVNGGKNSLLLGGGVVKSLHGKLAINLSMFYRINTEGPTGVSPWVFRIGISTVNKK